MAAAIVAVIENEHGHHPDQLDKGQSFVEDDDYVHCTDVNGDGVIDEEDIVDMPDMGRRLLVNCVERVVDRHDAFESLPCMVLYVIIFMFLIHGHLFIDSRAQVETALSEYLNGRDEWSDAQNNIDNLDSYWEWLEGEGVFAMFGVLRYSSESAYKHYTLANRHTFIGDFKLHGVKVARVDTFNLMHSTTALASPSGSTYSSSGVPTESRTLYGLKFKPAESHLNITPGDHSGAASATISALKGDYWWNKDLETISLSLTTYDDFHGSFARIEFTVRFLDSGQVRQAFRLEVIDAWAHLNYYVHSIDGVFLLTWSYIAFSELLDMCRAWRQGCGECIDYFEFWNIVDWLSIMLGGALVAIQVLLILLVVDERLTRFLDQTTYKFKDDPLAIETKALDGLNEVLDSIAFLMNVLEQSMALNTCSIVAKFFKGFSSNARLALVASTFSSASTDFIHFGIVLLAIFLPFVMIGHILFGADIAAFGSMFSAVSNSFLALFGEFFWYVDEMGLLTFTGLLPSTLPKVFVQGWYLSYMMVVFLVLLNLLLAIIIEHYTTVTGRVHSDYDAVPLWVQIRRYREFKKKTRGFISFETLLAQLEDDDEPAHTELEVSKESLMRAFPDMKEDQAEWMMEFLEHRLSLQQDHGHVASASAQAEEEACAFESNFMWKAMEMASHEIENMSAAAEAVKEAQHVRKEQQDAAAAKASAAAKAAEKAKLAAKKRKEAMLHRKRDAGQQTDPPPPLLRDEVRRELLDYIKSTQAQLSKLQRAQANMGKKMDDLITGIVSPKRADDNDMVNDQLKSMAASALGGAQKPRKQKR